jgi:hypothetical protein
VSLRALQVLRRKSPKQIEVTLGVLANAWMLGSGEALEEGPIATTAPHESLDRLDRQWNITAGDQVTCDLACVRQLAKDKAQTPP